MLAPLVSSLQAGIRTKVSSAFLERHAISMAIGQQIRKKKLLFFSGILKQKKKKTKKKQLFMKAGNPAFYESWEPTCFDTMIDMYYILVLAHNAINVSRPLIQWSFCCNYG